MSLLLLVALCIVLTSAMFFTVAWSVGRIFPSTRDWPFLWALCVGAPLAVPFVGLGLTMLAPAAITEVAGLMALHDALPALDPILLNPVDSRVQVPVIDWSLVGKVAALAYGLGVLLSLIRLISGRHRVAQIARGSVNVDRIDGVQVYISDSATVPFAWTPFGRPKQSRIVIPKSYLETFSTEQLAQIARHEKQHIQRRDDETGLVLRIALATLWAVPSARAAFANWVQACEVQCDAAILSGTSQEMRSTYAKTILQALHITANRVVQYPAASFSTHRLRNEKMRIRHIMAGTVPAFKRSRDRLVAVGAATCIAVGGGVGFASFASADPGHGTKGDKGTVTVGSMVTGRLTAPFGKTFDPFRDGTTRVHHGIDIAAPTGTPILAPADGVVVAATDLYDNKPAYGKVVVIETGSNTLTLFSHLDSYSVSTGDRIKKGDQIAAVGNTGKSTGPHVHIETRKDGTRVDPATVWTVSK